jgi:lysine-specific demethylase 8
LSHLTGGDLKEQLAAMHSEVQEIDRVERPSPDVFYRKYVSQNRPAIITGLADRWSASSVWTPEYFRSAFPGIKVTQNVWDGIQTSTDPAHYLANYEYQETLLGDFIDRVLASRSPEKMYYLTQFPIFDSIPQLRADIKSMEPLMGIPRFYKMRRRLGITVAPSFWMGPAGATSVLHFDGYENFYAEIYGRKRFVLISPAQSKYVYYPHYEFTKLHFSPVNIEQPDLAQFPLFMKARPLDFIIEPGEILYIPVRWWHYARSLDVSIGINFWWQVMRTVITCRHHGYIKFRRKFLNKLKEYGLDLGNNLRY